MSSLIPRRKSVTYLSETDYNDFICVPKKYVDADYDGENLLHLAKKLQEFFGGSLEIANDGMGWIGTGWQIICAINKQKTKYVWYIKLDDQELRSFVLLKI